MIAHFHPHLTQERWNAFSKAQQILNIASELSRAKNAQELNEQGDISHSLDRSLELIDLTVEDRDKWKDSGLKELLRLREHVGNFYSVTSLPPHELKRAIRCLLNFNSSTSLVEIQ